MNPSPRVVFMGTPEIAAYCLGALQAAQFDVVGVVTVADKPAGRGKHALSSPVKQYALEHQIPVLQPEKLRDPEFLKELSAWRGDLFVIVAFRMLPKVVWDMPPMGSINLHASLLPQYRGAAPIQHVIFNGETQTGVTCFLLNEDIDSGAILSQRSIPIHPRETGGSLHDKIMKTGAELLIETVRHLSLHTHQSTPQDFSDPQLHLAPKIFKEHCKIDWTQEATQIDRLVRGLSPYPGAYTFISKEGSEPIQMKIFEVEIAAPESPRQGSNLRVLQSDGKNYLSIDLQDGSKVYVLDLQLSGKRRMPIQEFLKGFKDITSYRLDD